MKNKILLILFLSVVSLLGTIVVYAILNLLVKPAYYLIKIGEAQFGSFFWIEIFKDAFLFFILISAILFLFTDKKNLAKIESQIGEAFSKK